MCRENHILIVVHGSCGRIRSPIMYPLVISLSQCQQLMAMEQESSSLQSHCTEQACLNWVLHGGVQSWLASKRGKSYRIPAAPTLLCPVGRDELPEQSVRESSSAVSLQNPADQLMVLTGLLKIANRLQLFTPHRILGGSRDVSYGNHYRTNHWALSSLHKWTEHDWVSRGSPFNMCKECDPPASSPQNMPKVSPLRSEWSRFALCLPNNSFTKSLNIGKLK